MADERTDDEILRRLHRGLRERRSPQDVAVDLVALRAERWLSAVGARDLYGLMRRRNAWQGMTDPTAWSMPSVWRHHPGLARAYAAARTAMADGALAAPTCRPVVLAAVLTRWRVLDLLSDAECGALLGRYYEQMAACARALRAAYEPNRDPRRMIVRAGDDSSTWNAASRAFNQARTGWLNLARGLGYDDLVEASCPGKVPALVAADVAAWHAREGRDQHADVLVWAELPLPWDVVLGDDECPADLVRDVCGRHGMDPERSGWTQPFRQELVELPEPAPDLVHGVVVTSPLLATVLRRAGIFSGQA